MPSRNIVFQPWLYIVLCLLTYLFGGLFQPGDWYQTIERAPWTPPNLAFPIVWTILYVLIAWAGILVARSQEKTLIRLWFAQLFFNGAWSWLFFGQHWTIAALIDLILVVVFAAGFMLVCFRQQQMLSAWLFVPYLAWLCLATSLNAYIVIHN